MPSPNAVNRPVLNKSQNKVDFGQKLSKRKSQEFSAKIASWNSHGGGITHEQQQDDEIVVVIEESDVEGHEIVVVEPIRHEDHDDKENRVVMDNKKDEAVTPERITTRILAREVDVTRKAWVRRKSKTQADKVESVEVVDVDVKHAGTPKKRVVSDGHWRRDRTAKAPTPEKEKPIPVPKPLVIRNSVATVGLKLKPSVGKVIEEREARRMRRRPARKSTSRSRSREGTDSREDTPDYESSGTKLYVKRRTPSQQIDSRQVSVSGESDGAVELRRPVSTAKAIPTPLASPSAAVERYLKLLVPVDEQVSPKEPSKAPSEILVDRHRKHRPQPPSTTEEEEQILPPPPPIVYGNRIQGWLATTSDPFDDLGRPCKPAPLETQHDQHTSRGLPSEVNVPQSPQTPTLKRRGARRTATSPIKDRASRENSPQVEDDSVVPLPLVTRRTPQLSTIASVETFNSLVEAPDRHKFITDGSVLSRASDGDERHPVGGLKRRLTKHSDLVSALAVPHDGGQSNRTRNSIKEKGNVGEVMNDLSTDEMKYQRELRTLVDGVIPVLLQYVLSDAQNVTSTGLLGQKVRDTQLVTKPIVDMGVALERLKNVHKRIPLHDSKDLLTWAESAKHIYGGYISAWRLGFHDVVVNLAPAEGAEDPSWNDKLPRNNKNELISANGERVDVAYLLKRPLVRLKHLAKTFEALEQSESSGVAKDLALDYHGMVQQARKRASEEKARLEDEAAAAIDPTRARECRSLAPIAGVQIDATRCVRARDFFDIDFRHSNGQQINCRVELIIRDDAAGRGEAGDILFCEVSTTGKWLLFPPVHHTMISARRGRKAGQMVVMLRGYRNDGREWREVMALDAEDEESIEEWLSMLPTSPVPRNLAAKSSFDLKTNPIMSGALPESSSTLERLPSVREMEVPLGERFAEPTEVWDASEVNSDAGSYKRNIRRKQIARHRSQPAEPIIEEPYAWEKDRGSPLSEQYETNTKHNEWTPESRQVSIGEATPISKRPTIKKRTSSVPSMDFPTINKLRQAPTPQEPAQSSTPNHESPPEPSSAPSRLQKRTTPPDTKSRPTSFGLKSIPSFTPAFLKRHRRSSSPLKHEYEPSSASSLSDSEVSAVDQDESYTSDSTAEHIDDQISTLGELKSFPTYGGYKQMKQVTPPESLYAPTGPSLAPSESASQAPYRTVPVIESRSVQTVASIFAWAESGSWESLHPEDCCIIVTPGLIEAFDLTQAQAAPAIDNEEAMRSPSTRGVKPLVALELTPLVPLRRGTALDISIRSPPTANSLYRTGNNIMFRSRNAEECEALYHMLNRARIDNPTYIALQRARGPIPQSNWGQVMDQRNNERSTSASWFGLGSRKGSTYRSNSIKRPQSTAATESSVGTMQTAFSALRRFSGSNRIFNIAKSTITSRQGSRSTYSDSLDSGVASPAQIDPSMGTPVGLTNMKIRLYIRETASKWRDLGAARLTILIPPRPDPNIPANPMLTGREKRIIVSGKQQGQILVDATLGEAAFERIARTGIAMSVWEENVDGLVATTGGVLAAKTRVYMIQMKSDREAAYTFGLVGKLRY